MNTCTRMCQRWRRNVSDAIQAFVAPTQGYWFARGTRHCFFPLCALAHNKRCPFTYLLCRNLYVPFTAWLDFLHLPSACHVIKVWKRQFWQPRHQFGQSRATNFGHLTLSPDTAWWCKMCVFYVVLMFCSLSFIISFTQKSPSWPPQTTSLSWPWSSSPSDAGSSNL